LISFCFFPSFSSQNHKNANSQTKKNKIIRNQS
jgi:hypothetical protein